MRATYLKVVAMGAVVSVGMLGVVPGKAVSADRADVASAIEETQRAAEEVAGQATSIAVQVQTLTADVARLEQSIKEAKELIASARSTAEDLVAVDPEFESLTSSASPRRMNLGVGGDLSIGQARLTPMDRSGVHANIVFVDDGTTLVVSGTATGLDPAESYGSQYGPEACLSGRDRLAQC